MVNYLYQSLTSCMENADNQSSHQTTSKMIAFSKILHYNIKHRENDQGFEKQNQKTFPYHTASHTKFIV